MKEICREKQAVVEMNMLFLFIIPIWFYSYCTFISFGIFLDIFIDVNQK